MGKPYWRELGHIPATIRWSLSQDVSELRDTLLRKFAGFNLVTIGSGGSHVSAAYAALLHETFTGLLARPTTPLEAITRPPPRETAALLLSAEGTNADIRRVAEMLPRIGYDAVSAICTRIGSPLKGVLATYGATTHEFSVPTGRDGFLATNSLMAILVLLYRATISKESFALENQYNLVGSLPSIDGKESVLGNRTLIVLAQGWAMPAALDLESRFSEAGIANVSVSDPRNFAHGRHNWLSLHGEDSGIVSLETKESTREATRMLRLLPRGTEILRVKSESEGPAATIQLIHQVMGLAGKAAASRGIDPGRPEVAEFGRRLYRAGTSKHLYFREQAPISRKKKALSIGPRTEDEGVTSALCEFLQKLANTRFSGLAIDYDGTLCASERRFEHLDTAIRHELNRLLEEGIVLGIATGRGRSVYRELRESLFPRFWNRVLVGLYNGSRIISLSEDATEDRGETPPHLAAARARLLPLEGVLGFETMVRPQQISLWTHSGPDPSKLRAVVAEQLSEIEDLSVVMSSHSVDIFPAGTSKLAVVKALQKEQPGYILRIGDQGAGGGNDFELLNSGLALSVDRVSSSLETCWNLGAPGLSGPQLTLQYLRALSGDNGEFHMDTSPFVSVD